jgi:hypothetical protein
MSVAGLSKNQSLEVLVIILGISYYFWEWCSFGVSKEL